MMRGSLLLRQSQKFAVAATSGFHVLTLLASTMVRQLCPTKTTIHQTPCVRQSSSALRPPLSTSLHFASTARWSHPSHRRPTCSFNPSAWEAESSSLVSAKAASSHARSPLPFAPPAHRLTSSTPLRQFTATSVCSPPETSSSLSPI